MPPHQVKRLKTTGEQIPSAALMCTLSLFVTHQIHGFPGRGAGNHCTIIKLQALFRSTHDPRRRRTKIYIGLTRAQYCCASIGDNVLSSVCLWKTTLARCFSWCWTLTQCCSYCWPTVAHSGPELHQHWVNISRLPLVMSVHTCARPTCMVTRIAADQSGSDKDIWITT